MKTSSGRRPVTAIGLLAVLVFVAVAAGADPPKRDVPTQADLAKLTKDKVQFIDRLLTVIEKEIVPLTQKGVRQGNKLFGGAVIKKSDLSTVVAVTNSETGNPLMHGEITAIHAFYDVPRDRRPPAKECIFICTHEPCPLCLSGITWAGFDNFFYLFSYEDTKDAFNIPHDLRMLEEIFRVNDGNYAQKNHYWSSWGLRHLVASCEAKDRKRFIARIEALRKTYDAMSAIYQKSKGQGVDIPLK
ncbi:MAG: nucleoside deaminase [Planctomycetota bacterium]|jgi:tRNA(Arg) A34 adenosine deaminase TadA